MKTFLIGVILSWTAATTASQAAVNGQPVGHWVGHWTRDGSSVNVTMRISKSPEGYEGSFDSEGLRAVGIPLQKVTWRAPALNWEVAGDATTDMFSGQLRGDLLAGQFKHENASGTFSFKRSKQLPPRPRREDITFTSGDALLAGTILVPRGKGPHPGIVFLHGSGPEGRWASNYLAESFARKGFAALIFDKRGVGLSAGRWQDAGFEELAADAAAAVAALSMKTYVDRQRVGIHGHSQGATLSPMAARLIGNPAFVIASAPSGLSMRDTEAYSLENALGVKQMAPQEGARARRFIDAIVAAAYDGESYQKVLEAWQECRTSSWAFEPPPPTHYYWAFSRKIASFDAAAYWSQVSAPTLVVSGEKDERIPAHLSAARIAEAYLRGAGTSLSVKFFPGADHTYRIQPDNAKRYSWPKTAPDYPDAIIAWAREVVGLTQR